MGLYIKGLDMPKESILMTIDNGSAYVIPVGEDEGKSYEVIEVKTPHGRLIDDELLCTALDTELENDTYVKEIWAAIEQLPSAEKTGKWIDEWRSGIDGTRYWYRACSECGYERDDDDAEKDTNYCPNCGSRMW